MMVVGFSFGDLLTCVHRVKYTCRDLATFLWLFWDSMNSMPVQSLTMMWLNSIDFHFIVHGLDDLRG